MATAHYIGPSCHNKLLNVQMLFVSFVFILFLRVGKIEQDKTSAGISTDACLENVFAEHPKMTS